MGFGGSEAVAMWAAEALKADYRIALVAGGKIDLPALNSRYGTSVTETECQVVQIPIPWPFAAAGWGDALRGAIVARGVRRQFDRFDVLINSYNLANFGRPGIHLLADFSWNENLRRTHEPTPSGPRRIAHVVKPVRRSYLGICRAIAGPVEDPLYHGAGIVLANSEWSKRKLRELSGIDSRVLYPPAVMNASASPATMRREFVCVGRIAPEKRIERIIAILERVRARGHAVTLRIIGETGQTAYGRVIERLCRSKGGWILLEGGRFGADKARILTECAFGINAREGEAFGIAVAEMVRAGCIAFASAVGGPAEILGHPALLYRSEDDAVEKICAVMESERMCAELRAHLSRQAAKFSAEKFMNGIRDAVRDFLRQTGRSMSSIDAPARRERNAEHALSD
jgi:glycosyltransferase involved in cell wall biosynthesis